MGLRIDYGIFYSLYFADDQVVLSQDADDLSYMVILLPEYYQKACLKINMEKSEHLTIGNNNIKVLQIKNNEIIKGEQKCKYFGIIFDKTGNSDEKIALDLLRQSKFYML